MIVSHFPNNLPSNNVLVYPRVLSAIQSTDTLVEDNLDADVALIWSVLWFGKMSANKRVWDHFRKQNKPVVVIDVGYSGNLKNKSFGIISKLVANGRHLNLSQIYTSQRFSMISTTVRSNITGAILFSTSAKELDLITDDFNYLENKKEFVKMFRNYTSEPRSFLVINFTNKDGLYMDSQFQTIKGI